MPDVFLGIGIAVVKIAAKLWLKTDPLAAEMSGPVVDFLSGQVRDKLDKRRARRLVEHLEEMVQTKLESSIGHEFAGLPPNEREATLLAVADSFDRARLTDADLFATDLDDTTLIRYIDRFLMFYVRTADRLQRTATWLEGLSEAAGG